MTLCLFRFIMTWLVAAFCVAAHPMGNFSVSHYSKIQVTADGVQLEYVLDLAEIPTSLLFSSWNIDRTAPQRQLEERASEQAREWLKNLAIEVDGKPVQPRFRSAKLVVADGAGGLPIVRITTIAQIIARSGSMTYEDRNFPDRTGWKEIVIDEAAGARLQTASQTSRDVSHALTQYPAAPQFAPPQDLRAQLTWVTAVRVQAPPTVTPSPQMQQTPVVKAIAQPKPIFAAAAPVTLTAAGAPAGSVVKGDFLSRLLHQSELSSAMVFLALGAAFLLGAAHALTPGHGKTIVAAYLVGSRGTIKHAAFLGAMVTFTHTISVFALGIATLFLYRFIVPEQITKWLGTISGLSIVAVGAWMLIKRLRSHSHSHGHKHTHSHAHNHHGANRRSGHSHSHSHVPDEMSWRGLAILGISGGLVPCESALVLLLGAIALNRVLLGLALLLSFSVGLAVVLVAIGIAVLYAKNLLPSGSSQTQAPWLRWATIASPAVVVVVGFLLTGVSLGWIQSKWMLG